MSVDNRTIINDCESNTGWTGDDGTPTAISDAGQFYQNANALATQLSNVDETTYTTQDSVGAGAFSLDWSDSTLYLLVKDNLQAAVSAGGVQFVIGDGTDRIGYDVGGNNARGLALPFYFACFKLDVSVVVTTPGTFTNFAGTEAALDQTAITTVGYGTIHLAKAVGAVDNVFIDCIRYIANGSYALTINGGTVGTPETMADVQGDDATASNGWGMVSNPLGSQYQFIAPTEWGTPSGTADSYFTGADEQWYWLGGNGVGGHAVAATHFNFRLIGNGTGTNSFVLTSVGIVNIQTRAAFDLSDANMDIVKLTGCSFTGLGAITLPVQDAGNKFVNDTAFNNCDQADLQSCDCDGCTFNGTTDANGAIIWDETVADVANQDNLTFKRSGTHNAIEIAPTGAGPFTYAIDGYTFDGFASQDDGDAVEAEKVFFINPATLSADITINLTNATFVNIGGGADTGTDGKSWREVASYSGTVTINQNVQVTLTGLQNNTEITVYDSGTGAEIAHVENVTGNQFQFTDAAANVVDILIHHINYYKADILAYTIPAVNTSVPVQQTSDPNYVNP